ncbi:MAG: putative surface protein with fasciclin (FAS1) repeats [Pseudohongiellaceae bacterium]|jgi:uncharacterized surface protein with fasciclin (FAS1) repeats
MFARLISTVAPTVPFAWLLAASIAVGAPTSSGATRLIAPPRAAPAQETPAAEPQQSSTVLETLAAARGNFSILLEALKDSGLWSELSDSEPFTLFAPTDAALSSLLAETRMALGQPENAAELSRLLRYHVTSERWSLADIGQSACVVTREGGELRLRQLDDGASSTTEPTRSTWPA